jgi:integral membrane sensor domain MASE1
MRIAAPRVVTPAAEYRRHLIAAAAVAIGYFLLARYSLSLPVKQSGISYIWPADGLALGALLATPRRFWPLYLVAVFTGNLSASNKAFDLALLYSLFNVMEPLLVATVITRIRGIQPRIDTLRDCAKLVALILSTMAVAVLASNTIDWLLHQGIFWRVWLVWYVSDSLGMLLVAAPGPRHRESLARGAAAPATAITAPRSAAPRRVPHPGELHLPGPRLRVSCSWKVQVAATPLAVPMIFMLWAPSASGSPAASSRSALPMGYAFFNTANGIGPFAIQNDNLNSALLHVQVSFAIATTLTLFIAARTVEWRHALAESQVSRKRLEFAIEASDMLVFETTTGSGDVGWSGDVRFVLGIEPEDLLDTVGWRRRIHPKTARASCACTRSSPRAGAPRSPSTTAFAATTAASWSSPSTRTRFPRRSSGARTRACAWT